MSPTILLMPCSAAGSRPAAAAPGVCVCQLQVWGEKLPAVLPSQQGEMELEWSSNCRAQVASSGWYSAIRPTAVALDQASTTQACREAQQAVQSSPTRVGGMACPAVSLSSTTLNT